MHIFSFRSWRLNRHIIMHKLSFIIFWVSSEALKDILIVNLGNISYFWRKLTVIGFILCQKCSIERQFTKNFRFELRMYFRSRISEKCVGCLGGISGILERFLNKGQPSKMKPSKLESRFFSVTIKFILEYILSQNFDIFIDCYWWHIDRLCHQHRP